MSTEVPVWDPLVRLFHWALVVSFFIAYFTEDEFEDIHVWSGYIVLALISVRIIWGLVGTKYARFSNFVYPPHVVVSYLKDMLSLKAKRYLGHNPVGGYMILALIVGLLITNVTGMAIYGIEEGEGPLSELAGMSHFWEEFFEELHEVFANLTLLLVFIHVSGVVVSSLLHNENLIRAMVTGNKLDK